MEDSEIMIPKIIHYCWFGGNPLPEMAHKCIESWKKYLPDYEIIEWNESNVDIDAVNYTRQAYSARKYAFVSDYVRFKVLYDYGGLYFDTDVEVIREMDDIVARGPFMGVESQTESVITVAPGLGLGVEPGNHLYKQIIDYYSRLSFLDENGGVCMTNVVDHITAILENLGLKNTPDIQECAGIFIYPKDFFCPIDYSTRELVITDNTRTIHHYAESWVPKSVKVKNAFFRVIGRRASNYLVSIKKTIKCLCRWSQ